MKPTIGTLVIALLLFASGCKLPQSAFETTENLIIKSEKAETVCTPLINAAVIDLDNRIEHETDPIIKESLVSQKKQLIKVRDGFPKIVRNLKKLLELMEKFNDVFGDKEDKAVKPDPAPTPPAPAPAPDGGTP